MAKIQHDHLLPLVWADDIEVDGGLDSLFVTGTTPSMTRTGDAYRGYLSWTEQPEKGGGLRAPHVRFANATSDKELTDFVRAYGPVAASRVERLSDDSNLIFASQSLDSLRRERRIYAAALGLITELEKEKSRADLKAITSHLWEICEGCVYWPKECEKQNRWYKSQGEWPQNWRFGEKEREYLSRLNWSAEKCPVPRTLGDLGVHAGAYRSGHYAVGVLVNSFIPEVRYSDKAFEAPAANSIKFGVRPILYYILRQEYLRRSGIRRCANVRCNHFFSVERYGQNFCTPTCSRQQRQREYWEVRGGSLRDKRHRKGRKRRNSQQESKK